MNINNITIQNQQQKPVFKSIDDFNRIKSLPNMVCAICGKKTISNDVYIKAITSISKPLVYNMGKGALDYLQKLYPLVWEQFQNFAERFPKLTIDEILEKEGNYADLKRAVVKTLEPVPVPCHTPERIELDRNIGKVFFDAIENARTHMKSSSVVMKGLMELKGYLDGIKKDVFEQFEIYARKYPKKTLSEIIRIPEIQKFHSVKNLLQRIETREKLDYHFENIRELVKKKNPKAVEHFDELKEKVLEMFETEKDEDARIYYAKNMYKEALKKHKCDSIEEAVLNEIDQVPRSFLTKDSYFNYIYNHGYTDGRIIFSLFSPLLASEDHILAVSRGGLDRHENKCITHRACNGMRGSKPYSEMVKFHPEMPNYAQEQMDIVTQNILNHNLPNELLFYPVKTAETYYRESNGNIDLDITDYCIKGMEQSSSRLDNIEAEVNSLSEEKQKIEEQISDLNNNSRKEKKLQYRLKEYLEKH